MTTPAPDEHSSGSWLTRTLADIRQQVEALGHTFPDGLEAELFALAADELLTPRIAAAIALAYREGRMTALDELKRLRSSAELDAVRCAVRESSAPASGTVLQ